MKILLVVFFSLVIAGCGAPTIDGSSDEAMKASVQKIRNALPEAERAAWDTSLQAVMFDTMAPSGNIFAAAAQDPAAVAGQLRSKLNGMTAEQVIAMADSIREARKLKEREQALAEINELIEKQASSEAAKADLAKFEVKRSRFSKQAQRYGRDLPIIELDVVNGTSVAVSRAYFAGTISSPGRSVPWLKDTFNYPIKGGLEPGESASWRLAPNMFSDWDIDVPADAVLTVEVVRIDGPDGEAAFDARAFTDSDRERLESLKASLE